MDEEIQFRQVVSEAIREGHGELFNMLPVEVRVAGETTWRPTILWAVKSDPGGGVMATVLVPDPREEGALPGIRMAQIDLAQVRFAKTVEASTGALMIGLLKAEIGEQTNPRRISPGERFEQYHREWPAWRDAFLGEENSQMVDGKEADQWTRDRVGQWLSLARGISELGYLSGLPCLVFDPISEDWWATIGRKEADRVVVLMGEGPGAQWVDGDWVAWSNSWSATQVEAAQVTAWGLRAMGYLAVLSKLGWEEAEIEGYPMLAAVSEKGLTALQGWKARNGVEELKGLGLEQWGLGTQL